MHYINATIINIILVVVIIKSLRDGLLRLIKKKFYTNPRSERTGGFVFLGEQKFDNLTQ